jgi:hypothetical protein
LTLTPRSIFIPYCSASASDQSEALLLEPGNPIEDGANSTAPGSPPFLNAAGVLANIQSQAMMQMMLAAMLRQEATKIRVYRSWLLAPTQAAVSMKTALATMLHNC